MTEAIQSRDGRRSAQQAERGALWISVWATVVIAVGALVLGVVTGTRIIVFDGAYMTIGLVLSVASLRAAAMVDVVRTGGTPSAVMPSRRWW